MDADAGVGDGGSFLSHVDCSLAMEFPAVTHCSDIPDATLLAFAYCDPFVYKIPDGYYNQEPALRSWWEEPCSLDAPTTLRRAKDWAAGEGSGFRIVGESATPYFYQVSVEVFGARAGGGSEITKYRNTKCEYFDGTVIGGAPHDSPDALAFLATYLWYQPMDKELWNGGDGSNVLAVLKSRKGKGFEVNLCSTAFEYAGFFACDRVSLVQTTFSEDAQGKVTIGIPTLIRAIHGDCYSDI